MEENKKVFRRPVVMESIGSLYLKEGIDPFDVIFVNGKKLNIQLKNDGDNKYEILAARKGE